jgi:environmental stress-induced protein Ves
MKLIRYTDLPALPWKNGLGIRRDIAQGRYQSGDLDTTWLVSIADLNENTLFSTYPGTMRWFLPISTGWVTLNFDLDGVAMPVELSHDSPTHQFSGDSSVHCILRDGPMKALNVMVSSDDVVLDTSKSRILETTQVTLPSNQDGSVSILIVIDGVCRVRSDTWSGPVATLNSLVNDSGQNETFEISSFGAAEIVIATISRKCKLIDSEDTKSQEILARA